MSVLISTKVLSEPSAATVSRGGMRTFAESAILQLAIAKADLCRQIFVSYCVGIPSKYLQRCIITCKKNEGHA
jgi:hypothetical protein